MSVPSRGRALPGAVFAAALAGGIVAPIFTGITADRKFSSMGLTRTVTFGSIAAAAASNCRLPAAKSPLYRTSSLKSPAAATEAGQ